MRLHLSIGCFDCRRTTRLRQCFQISRNQFFFAGYVHRRSGVDRKFSCFEWKILRRAPIFWKWKECCLIFFFIFGYFGPTSTLLHGHIDFAIPSLLETDRQILEHWAERFWWIFTLRFGFSVLVKISTAPHLKVATSCRLICNTVCMSLEINNLFVCRFDDVHASISPHYVKRVLCSYLVLLLCSFYVVCVLLSFRRTGPPSAWPPSAGPPLFQTSFRTARPPKISLFFPLATHFCSFCLSLVVFSLKFGGFCEDGDS